MDAVWIVSGAILAIGIFIFLLLVLKKRKKHKAIKHYEKLRDKLSVREAEKKTGITEDEFNNYDGSLLGTIQSFFMTLVVVGVTLVIGIYISSEIGEVIEQNMDSNVNTVASDVQTEFTSNISNFLPWIFISPIIFLIIVIITSKHICYKAGEI